jgi:Tfp pilus assembly protein PilX
MDEENPMRTQSRDEQGFALILAILSLMLLTFLGLALAATTSTEMQIATNYRWSQQALYNAESGLEIGRNILQPLDWSTLVPPARAPWVMTCTVTGGVKTCTTPDTTSTWQTGNWAASSPAARAAVTRDYENGACDVRGSRMGFGRVLTDNVVAESPYQNKTTVRTVAINGAFTLWVARPQNLVAADAVHGTETWQDDASNDHFVLTAEGIAPYVNDSSAIASQGVQANRAVRYVQMNVSRVATVGYDCGARAGQAGGGSEGSGYGGCTALGVSGKTSSGVQTGLGLSAAQAKDTGVK